MNRHAYPAVLEPDEDGRIVVRIPDVPEALTDGADRAEALSEARDCLDVALGGYVQERRNIPRPSRRTRGQEIIYLSPLVAAKLALYEAMQEQGVSNVALAERLGIDEKAVRRLVHPDHRSRIEKVQAALEALGRLLLVDVTLQVDETARPIIADRPVRRRQGKVA
jgi:antitoxin HicB